MKKILVIAAAVLVSIPAMAQRSTKGDANPYVNRRGIALLPKAGDFAISVDATPILDYAGNMFGKINNNSAPSFGSDQFTVYGKYFLQNDRAIRARLTLDMGSKVTKRMVSRFGSTTPNDFVEDEMKVTRTKIELGVGYEFRRGKGRVQGFYGGEVFLGYASGKTKFDYANAVEGTGMYDWTDWNTNMTVTGGPRATEAKNGGTFNIGVAGFAGVEYFFAPQMSLGGEVGLGLEYSTTAKGKNKSESWNGTAVEVTEIKTAGASSFDLSTKGYSRITLNFHF